MSPWCPYSEPGSTVPPNTFRRHFVIRQQYTHFTRFIIINNLHLHDRGSVGSLTSVRLTLGVHSHGQVSQKHRGGHSGREKRSSGRVRAWTFLPIRLIKMIAPEYWRMRWTENNGRNRLGADNLFQAFRKKTRRGSIWTAPGTGNKVWAKIELYKLVIPKKLPTQQNSLWLTFQTANQRNEFLYYLNGETKKVLRLYNP